MATRVFECFHSLCNRKFRTAKDRDIHYQRQCSRQPDPGNDLRKALLAQHHTAAVVLPKQVSSFDGENPYLILASQAQRRALSLLDMLKHDFHMHGTASQRMKTAIDDLFKIHLECIQLKLEDRLGTTIDTCEISKAFESPWRGMETQAYEDKLRKEVYGGIIPAQRALLVQKGLKRCRDSAELSVQDVKRSQKKAFCYDVVVEKNMQDLWNKCPELYHECQTYVKTALDDPIGTVRDYVHTTEFREFQKRIGNPAFQTWTTWSDDFVVTNPINWKTGRCKMHAMMYVCNNLPPLLRFDTPNIQLANIVRTQDMKDAGGLPVVICGGFDADPQRLKKCTSWAGSMYRFSEGIKMKVPTEEGTQVVYGGQWASQADALEDAGLAGTKESFGPGVKRPCRNCMISNIEVRQPHCFMPDVPGVPTTHVQERTVELWKSQVSKLQSLPGYKLDQIGRPYIVQGSAASKYSTETGLNTHITAFHAVPDIAGFHAISRMSRDLMHTDMVSGNMQRVTNLFLHQAIVELEWFSRAELNRAMDCFRWNVRPGQEVPPPFDDSHFHSLAKKKSTPKYSDVGYTGKALTQNYTIKWPAHVFLVWTVNCLGLLFPLIPQSARNHPVWLAYVKKITAVLSLLRYEYTDDDVKHSAKMCYEADVAYCEIPAYSKHGGVKAHQTNHIHKDITAWSGSPRNCWNMKLEGCVKDLKGCTKGSKYKDPAGSIAHNWVDRRNIVRSQEKDAGRSKYDCRSMISNNPLTPGKRLHRLFFEKVTPRLLSQPVKATWYEEVSVAGQHYYVGTCVLYHDGSSKRVATVTGIFEVVRSDRTENLLCIVAKTFSAPVRSPDPFGLKMSYVDPHTLTNERVLLFPLSESVRQSRMILVPEESDNPTTVIGLLILGL